MRCRRENLEVVFFQKRERLVARRLDDRHREHRPSRGPHHVRVVNVGRPVTDNHRRDLRRIGRAQDRAKIARLLDRLRDNHERILGELQIDEFDRHVGTHHQQTVWPFFIRDLLKADLRAGVDLCPRLLRICDQRGLVLALEIQLRAVKDRPRAISEIQRTPTLAIALDDHLARLLASRAASQLHDVLEFRITRARYFHSTIYQLPSTNYFAASNGPNGMPFAA